MQICPYFPYLFWVLTVFKVDKGKASWASWLLVIHNVDITQRAIFGENFPEIPLSGVQTQSKHTQTVVWIWVGLRSMRRDVKTQINNKIPHLWNIKWSEVVIETFCVQKLKNTQQSLNQYMWKKNWIHTLLPMCLRRFDIGERLWLRRLWRRQLRDRLLERRRCDRERERE